MSEPRNIVAEKARTGVIKASFAVRVTKLWNRVLAEHKNVSSGMVFKRICKWEKPTSDSSEDGGWRSKDERMMGDVTNHTSTDAPTASLPGDLGRTQ